MPWNMTLYVAALLVAPELRRLTDPPALASPESALLASTIAISVRDENASPAQPFTKKKKNMNFSIFYTRFPFLVTQDIVLPMSSEP